jgi:hypothetical protein
MIQKIEFFIWNQKINNSFNKKINNNNNKSNKNKNNGLIIFKTWRMKFTKRKNKIR